MENQNEIKEEVQNEASVEHLGESLDVDCLENDILQQVIEELSREIPDKTKINIPKETSADDKIDSFNEDAKNIFLRAFAQGEDLRLKRQKPMMIAIVSILALQLAAFNVLMFVVVFKSFTIISTDTQLFGQLLDFFKYYVGVVIIELIGLMVTITKNTFSKQSDKIIEKITKNK